MSGVNLVVLIGNLGQDPDVRTTPQGKQVANFSLAVSEKFKDRDGAMQDKVEWVTCVLWEKNAELAQRYLKKGSQLYVEGRLQTRTFDDKNGVKQYRTEVVVSKMTFLGGGRGDGASDAEPRQEQSARPAQASAPRNAPQKPAQRTAPQGPPAYADDDDGVPF